MIISDVDVSLFIGAIIVALISWHRNRRGVLWIGVAALSYINATIAWRMELPYAEAITGLGDAAVCLAVYFFGRQMWELWVWRLFQTSVAVSMLYLAGHLGIFANIPHEIYSILLEAANWMLLLLIGSMSILQRLGATNVSARRPWNRVRHFALVVQQKRARAPFTAVK